MRSRPHRFLSLVANGLVASGMLLLAANAAAEKSVVNLGRFAKWEKVEVTLTGPAVRGLSDSNPFGVAVDGIFTAPSGKTSTVPGFYDGDGKGGLNGNVWKVRFSADEVGQWSFRSRSENRLLDSVTGSFTVTQPATDAPDFYRWGRLEAVGTAENKIRYLKFRDGPYWLKAGCDDPENFLGKYKHYDTLEKRKAAIDYLSERGVNSLYIMSHNVDGDDKDVWPWLGSTAKDAKANGGANSRFDVTKLEEWRLLFEYMQQRGMVVYLVLFGKIFGGKAEDMERQKYLLESGRSLLDDVSEDARILSGQVGRQDRDKLDEYLTGVREVEKKLARRRDWLDKPFPVRELGFSLPENEVVAESMLLQNEDLMWDLMALAIKNDSCRVFSLTIPLGGAALLLGNGLTSMSYHGLSHHGNKKNKVDELVAVESVHMAGAARFMKSLKETRESDGSSMLDNTTLLIGSAMADASKHRRVDYPLMIAGGGYKHKRHVSCGADHEHKNEMACDLYVTVLQQLGFEMDSFASSTSNLNGALL